MGVLPVDFAERLADMAAFRNVLVHLYIEVDLDLLYGYLQEGLGDLERYTRYVGEYLAQRDDASAASDTREEGTL